MSFMVGRLVWAAAPELSGFSPGRMFGRGLGSMVNLRV